jgi:hypothetical protein
MAIRHLPVVGRPTSTPTSLRKIAIEGHFADPAQVDAAALVTLPT